MNTQFAELVVETAKAFQQPKLEVDLNKLIDHAIAQKITKFRSGKPSKTFHPASMADMCVVKEAFKRIHNIWEDTEEHPPELLRIMEAGNGTHEWFQNNILPNTGKLWGHWKCTTCNQITTESTIPDLCPNEIDVHVIGSDPIRIKCSDAAKINKVQFSYIEPKIVDIDYNISGRIDGMLTADRKWRTLELKSTTEDNLNGKQRSTKNDQEVVTKGFDMLPFNKHVIQTSIYLGIIYEKYIKTKLWPIPAEDFDGGYLVYISRETFKTRTFQIPFSTKAYEWSKGKIDTINELILNGNPLNGQKKCANRNSPYAKTCPFRLTCFPYKKTKK